MHVAVLPDLELRQVKTKGLRLPHQVLQLAGREARGAGGGERILHRAQVVEQLRSGLVCEVLLTQARRADPAHHVTQKLPVWLGRGLRQSLPQRARRWCRLGIDGHRAAHPIGHGLEREQRVLRVDRHRLRRNLGRDSWVAVAIASDPAPEAKECRRAGSEGGVEGTQDLGHHAEQRLVEDGHERPHLVQRPDVRSAHLGCAPQSVDLFAEPPLRLRPLGVRDLRIVDRLELLADPPNRGHNRAAPRLRRMRREDRMDLQGREQSVKPLPAHFGPQLGDGRRD